MTVEDQISKLEALLARISSRASARSADPPVGTYDAPGLGVDCDEPAPDTGPSVDELGVDAVDYADEIDGSTVELIAEVGEVEVDMDDFADAAEDQSGAQLVAAPLPADEPYEEHTLVQPAPSAAPSALPSAPPSVPPSVPPETATSDELELSPSSSRRPILNEELSQGFDEDSSPRHTPPPESGKQVAAPVPSLRDAPLPRPSAPPESLEGHTLTGGWRDPVGVGAVPVVAKAETTRAELPASNEVAVFGGAARAFEPATFGDLLDASLSLR